MCVKGRACLVGVAAERAIAEQEEIGFDSELGHFGLFWIFLSENLSWVFSSLDSIESPQH